MSTLASRRIDGKPRCSKHGTRHDSSRRESLLTLFPSRRLTLGTVEVLISWLGAHAILAESGADRNRAARILGRTAPAGEGQFGSNCPHEVHYPAHSSAR